jgi:hypothetical protein
MCMDNAVNRKVEVHLSRCVLKGLITCISMWCIIVVLAVPLSLKLPGYDGATAVGQTQFDGATAADQTQFGNFHVRPSFLSMVAIE